MTSSTATLGQTQPLAAGQPAGKIVPLRGPDGRFTTVGKRCRSPSADKEQDTARPPAKSLRLRTVKIEKTSPAAAAPAPSPAQAPAPPPAPSAAPAGPAPAAAAVLPGPPAAPRLQTPTTPAPNRQRRFRSGKTLFVREVYDPHSEGFPERKRANMRLVVSQGGVRRLDRELYSSAREAAGFPFFETPRLSR